MESCGIFSVQLCNSGLYRASACVRSRQAISLRKFLPVGPQPGCGASGYFSAAHEVLGQRNSRAPRFVGK